MIYSFITDSDLDVGMKKYFRDQITSAGTNIHILKTSEGAAFSMLKTKLNNKYDLVQLFPPIAEWTDSHVFSIGQYCSKADVVYKASQGSTNSAPDDPNSQFWFISDPRDQLLVILAVALTLYYFTESVNPRKLTQDLKNGFASAMEFLDDIKEGNENPDWPLLINGTSTILWGANPTQNHYY